MTSTPVTARAARSRVTALRGATPATLRSAVKIARAELTRGLGSSRYGLPALHGIDRTLADRHPGPGVFLEIGANDGYSFSNTYHLEKIRGWRGILIEPLPTMYRLCRLHRRRSVCFNLACVGPDGPSSLTLVDRGLVSVSRGMMPAAEEQQRVGGHTREITVATSTMSALIDRSGLGTPDVITIDVEGAEREVLKGLDLVRHAPRFLVVETKDPEGISALLDPFLRPTQRLSHHDWLFERSP